MSELSVDRSQPAALDRETLIVAGVVMLGAVMSILDTTVVNVAIAHLAVAFRSSLTTIQRVITGYTLALAAVILVTRIGLLGLAPPVRRAHRCSAGGGGIEEHSKQLEAP